MGHEEVEGELTMTITSAVTRLTVVTTVDSSNLEGWVASNLRCPVGCAKRECLNQKGYGALMITY